MVKDIWTGRERFHGANYITKKIMLAILILIIITLLLLAMLSIIKPEQKEEDKVQQIIPVPQNISNVSKEVSKIPTTREFNITLSSSGIEPDKMTVNKNNIVKLHVKSIDSNCTLMIQSFFILTKVPKDKETTIKFNASKEGEFVINIKENERLKAKIIVI